MTLRRRRCRFLTDEGIEYLREYLNIPADVMPATLKKSTRPLVRQRPPFFLGGLLRMVRRSATESGHCSGNGGFVSSATGC